MPHLTRLIVRQAGPRPLFSRPSPRPRTNGIEAWPVLVILLAQVVLGLAWLVISR